MEEKVQEISKVKLADDTVYNFKDEEARRELEALLGKPINWEADT